MKAYNLMKSTSWMKSSFDGGNIDFSLLGLIKNAYPDEIERADAIKKLESMIYDQTGLKTVEEFYNNDDVKQTDIETMLRISNI